MTYELVTAAFDAWVEKVITTNYYLVEESKTKELVYYTGDKNSSARYGNTTKYNVYLSAGKIKLTISGGIKLAEAEWDSKNNCVEFTHYTIEYSKSKVRDHLIDFLVGYSQLIYSDMQMDNNSLESLENFAEKYLKNNCNKK